MLRAFKSLRGNSKISRIPESLFLPILLSVCLSLSLPPPCLREPFCPDRSAMQECLGCYYQYYTAPGWLWRGHYGDYIRYPRARATPTCALLGLSSGRFDGEKQIAPILNNPSRRVRRRYDSLSSSAAIPPLPRAPCNLPRNDNERRGREGSFILTRKLARYRETVH